MVVAVGLLQENKLKLCLAVSEKKKKDFLAVCIINSIVCVRGSKVSG